MEKVSSLMPGVLLQGGKYRIVRFIGAGGFGCTYEAIFELLGERVAIKEFFPHDLCNRDATGRMSVDTAKQTELVGKMRKKFVDEARTLFRYSGIEGIVKVTDVFEENGTSYFVMDYIEGQSLQKVMEANGPLAEAEALRIVCEAGQALQRVHNHGCLHLDIKPDNIMLGMDGHPIIIDFGVSKQYSMDDGCNTSTLMGCTPAYAPLEQIKGNVSAFSPATDVYALGATLYALLTGKNPPDASDLLNDDAILDFPSSVSVATREAIKKAMEPKVKSRPASVAEFLAMLPGGQVHSDGKKAVNSVTIASGLQPMQDRNLSNGTKIVDAKTPHGKQNHFSRGTLRILKHVLGITVFVFFFVLGWKWHPFGGGSVKDTEVSVENDKALAEEKIVIPNASVNAETAMIYAYAGKDDYRAYTIQDWEGLTSEQKGMLTPVGVQLTACGQQFIIALDAAGEGKEYVWEERVFSDDCLDIPNLKNFPYDNVYASKKDYDGEANTDAILAFGKSNVVAYPAAEAAHKYQTEGLKTGWYLPSAGQLWLICENKEAINKALSKINGSAIATVWSSTENDASLVWVGGAYDDVYYAKEKTSKDQVRPVASVVPARNIMNSGN
ncbi:MAG: serine/threonine protein kinase [Clostridium sp.]|nr:serine/threonine protein kinase [Clostridium sp.]